MKRITSVRSHVRSGRPVRSHMRLTKAPYTPYGEFYFQTGGKLLEKKDGKFVEATIDPYAHGVGSYEYKTIDARTVAGIARAERLQKQGWTPLSCGFGTNRVQLERLKKK